MSHLATIGGAHGGAEVSEEREQYFRASGGLWGGRALLAFLKFFATLFRRLLL